MADQDSTFLSDLQANLPGADSVLKKVVWGILFCQGLKVITLWRIAARLHRLGGVPRTISRFFSSAIVFFYGCYISPSARIGPGMRFPHPVGIVIGDGAVVGANCAIYQHVTIGLRKPGESAYPTLGDGVTLSAGSVVLGGIHIGERVTVGANSVVLMNCPSECTVVGIPARILP